MVDQSHDKSSQADRSLAESFHLVRSLMPRDQHMETASRDTTVAQALETMRRLKYSQLPVVAGRFVLGVFSYRSLATRLIELAPRLEDFASLPVEEFMEKYEYAQPSQDWESILDRLNSDDGVLVGNRDDLGGILTAADVLKYLHGIARPFLILAEIETSLRQLIRACVDDQTLQQCAQESLSGKYTQARMPSSVQNMEFNDYIQIICHGRNWEHFRQAFGAADMQRGEAYRRLTQVRDLRNVVFHFRRALTPSEHATLAQQREWLETKARAFEGQKLAKSETTPSRVVPPVKRWNEQRFLQELLDRDADAVKVAESILVWANEKAIRLWWGQGRQTGSFVPVFQNLGVDHRLFAVFTDSKLQFYFPAQASKPPFDAQEKLKQLVDRVVALLGADLPADADSYYVSVPLRIFRDEDKLKRLLAIYDWVIDEIRSSG